MKQTKPKFICTTSLPTTKEGAKALGYVVYYDGLPCLHGHYSSRHIHNGRCALCCSTHKLQSIWPKDVLFIPGLWSGQNVTFSRKLKQHYLHGIPVQPVSKEDTCSNIEVNSQLIDDIPYDPRPQVKRRYLAWYNGYYCDLGTYTLDYPYKAPEVLRTFRRMAAVGKKHLNK